MLGSSVYRYVMAAGNRRAANEARSRPARVTAVATDESEATASFRGSLAGTGPLPVVRLLQAAGASGCLRVERGALAGSLFLERGRIIAAAFAGEQGLAAVAGLAIALRDCRFRFEEGIAPDDQVERMAPLDEAALSAALDGLLGLLERLEARGLIEVVGLPSRHDGTPAMRDTAVVAGRSAGQVVQESGASSTRALLPLLRRRRGHEQPLDAARDSEALERATHPLRFWGRTIVLALVAAALLAATLWQRRLPPPVPGVTPGTVAQQTLPAGTNPVPALAGQPGAPR